MRSAVRSAAGRAEHCSLFPFSLVSSALSWNPRRRLWLSKSHFRAHVGCDLWTGGLGSRHSDSSRASCCCFLKEGATKGTAGPGKGYDARVLIKNSKKYLCMTVELKSAGEKDNEKIICMRMNICIHNRYACVCAYTVLIRIKEIQLMKTSTCHFTSLFNKK